MSDFPKPGLVWPPGSSIWTTAMLPFLTANMAECAVVNFVAGTPPAANRAIFVPFVVDSPVTAVKMFWENGASAGTTDVGIYDITNTRLVSLGATTNVGTSAVQVGDITDTLLTPGQYWAALVPSTITTQTYWSAAVGMDDMRAAGCYQMASASPLPSTSTPAAIGNSFLPMIGIQFRTTL